MSQIAHALAKAKERTGHTTAPFMVSGGSLPPFDAARSAASALALRKAKNRQRFWIILGVVALPLTGFVVWSQIRSAPEPVAVSTPTHESGRAEAVVAGATSSSAKTASSSSPSGASVAVQRSEVVQAVNSLPISAVMPGDPARIMLAGRVVRAGQAIDGGLTFSGLADGELRFTDAAGVVYTRRY